MTTTTKLRWRRGGEDSTIKLYRMGIDHNNNGDDDDEEDDYDTVDE